MRILIFFILQFFFSLAYGNNADSKLPPTIGNFSLPTSQQPGPLVSLGQNVIDKNVKMFFVFPDDYVGGDKHSADIVPSILYGITDNLSVFINIPIAATYKMNKDKSDGLEDAFIQLEYAFYNGKSSTFIDQATVVTNMTYPTGSGRKIPPTGFAAPSFFLGTTLSRMYTDWFYLTSYGITLTTAQDNTKFGNIFLYEAGLGRNITTTDHWIFAWMIEADGQYTAKNKISGLIDPNSGGNVVYLTPSFWASSKNLVFQLGVGLPITQHLFGNQTNDHYLLVGNIGWTVY